MELVKKRRAALRSAFTRVGNQLNDLLSERNNDIAEIETNWPLFEEKEQILRVENEAVLGQLLADDVSEDVLEAEIKSCDEYVSTFNRLKFQYKKVCQPQNDMTSANQSERGSSRQGASANRKFKLPTIEFKKFGGDVRDWLSFWGQFKKIDEDEHILPEDKFQYLLQAISPNTRARELIDSYPPTAENYCKAVESLKSRFGREDILVEVYVRELLKLDLSNTLSNDQRMGISTLYDKIETQLRALETLGITTDTCTAMLYPLVESCLPEDMLRVWQRSTFSGQSDFTLKDRLSRLMSFLKNEVENEERILLAVEGFGLGCSESKAKKSKFKPLETRQPTAFGLMNLQTLKCVFCDGTHSNENCFKAQKFSLEQKTRLLKDKRACFRCAKVGHQSRKCHERLKCVICGRQHIVILCPDLNSVKKSADNDPKGLSDEVPADELEKALANHTDMRVILQTLRVKIRSEHGSREIRAVIHSGSQRSYVLKATAKELCYRPKRTVKVVHALFGGVKSEEEQHTCYDVRLLSVEGKYACTFEVLDQDTICHGIAPIQPGVWMDELRRVGIELSDTRNADPIELLIGADVVGKLYTGRRRNLNCGLVAFETLLGWTLMGKIAGTHQSHSTTMTVTTLLSSDILIKLWQLDVLGIEDPLAQESKDERESAIKEFFNQNVLVNQDGRYQVSMPWVEGHPPLPSNYTLCRKRLEATAKRLTTDGIFHAYDRVFSDWFDEGIIEEVPASEINNVAHYLPHRPVIKENSTTKIRPVFDASARKKDKPSLNHCLEKGLNLIETIPEILLKFWMERIGVVSDIRKAFLQIGLSKRDQDCLRFLWIRQDGSEVIYRHKRVVFGVNCSPFLLGATIEHHLSSLLRECEMTENLYSKETILRLLDSFYVDNCVTSVPNQENLSKFIREATHVMALAKFDLRGWEFAQNIEEVFDTTSVLGLTWNRRNDSLAIHNECKIEVKDEPITKRVILSVAHRIFDPVGFTCPATVFPKLLLQKLWEKKLGWDVEVDDASKAAFQQWFEEIHFLFKIEIPRWIMGGPKEAQSLSMHVFCDASKHAYASAVFLRAEAQGAVLVYLVQAKVRVAPLKTLSIPRLELLAATIGARLYHRIQLHFSQDIETHFWSDSTTVLSWIRRSDEWATFVWNRTQEIRRLTSVDAWRHVPGSMNPADLPSRGCSPKYLLKSRWWEGPKWLYSPRANWPKEDMKLDEETEEEIDKERKKKLLTAMLNEEVDIWYAQYFSSYNRIVRMISWIRRLARNCRKSHDKIVGELSVEELRDGESSLIRLIQIESFGNEGDKRISSLCPYTDEHGVLRIRSRISGREDTEMFRFPFILPAKHTVVRRLIYDLHVSSCHVGVQGLLSILTEKYWVLGGSRAVRSAITNCVRCKRHAAKKLEIQPSPLPTDRVRDAATFQVTGIDLVGPVFLRNRKKAWICLYTCAVYRAVHLDVVTSLSTSNFMYAFRRFVARRGRPSIIYTDNGTNFVGTENVFNRLDWETIKQNSSTERIIWRFNPPSAPWWGGWWERLVGLVKQLLKRVLGRACLNTEELYTVLCDCEAVINARPLTYVTNEHSDLVPLTPTMFMCDLTESGIPDCDLVDSNALKKRLTYLQLLRQDLRRRLRIEYLGQLKQVFASKVSRNVSIGDVVLIGNDITKRIHWPLGRITELIPGKDNKVRLGRIQTSSGQLLRPIQRVYPLECVEQMPAEVAGVLEATVPEADHRTKKSADPTTAEEESVV